MSGCVLCRKFALESTPEPTPTDLPADDGCLIDCKRCGRFEASGDFLESHTRGIEDETVGLALSGLARQRTATKSLLRIDTGDYAELAESAPKPRSYAETIDRLVLRIAAESGYPGAATPQLDAERLAAPLYLPAKALLDLLRLLKEEALLQWLDEDPLRLRIRLTSKGWERVDRLQAGGPRSRYAFVAMSFAEDVRPAFDTGIQPALLECGFELPFRVDEPELVRPASYQPRIDDRIIARIRRSRIVVADVTGARPAVYYEAGFAAALGIPVIWCCRRNRHKRDMCFDTRQYEHILWDSPGQLRDSLVEKVRAHGWDVGQGGRQ